MAMYQKVVALNKETHRSHKLKPISDLSFTADMQTIPVVPTEFVGSGEGIPYRFCQTIANKQRDAAHAATRAEERRKPLCQKRWYLGCALYTGIHPPLPIHFRHNRKRPVHLVCGQRLSGIFRGRRNPLIDGNEESAFLKELLSFVTNYHRDAQMTPQFVAKLQALDLLEERNLKAEMKDGREFTVRGFYVVNEAKLVKLDAAQAHELFTTGALALVYAHLISLSNMNRLVDMEASKTRES